MPATDLIRVDLPAPLSPTSAIPSPRRTSKSTSVSAWTDPNDFETPRSSRIGVSFTVGLIPDGRWGRRAAPPPERLLFAELRELSDADVALLQEAVREEELVVALRDRDRLQLRERDHPCAVRDLGVHAGRLAALDQGDGQLRRRARLELDRLVDRHALP